MATKGYGTGLIPWRMIRRFDVFAEYNRIKNEQKGMHADQAKGHALWVAKVVAARKFVRTVETRKKMSDLFSGGREPSREEAKYRELGGEPQTAQLFDREIIERIGEEFYLQVFSPAVAKAIEEHERYEDFRDSLRVPWNLRMAA
jgi:hypothetical protein